MTPAEDYAAVHARRYQWSLDWIAPIAEAAGPFSILDLGGISPFTNLLQDRWPGKLVAYYNGDLREGFVIPDCDLVLCMECLEHVADIEREDLQTEWRGSGTHMLLESCWVSLKPGGHLFLTTPNANSITTIHHALNHQPPMMYRPHVREYSPYELDEMIRQIGFEIIRRETLDCWLNAIGKNSHRKIAAFINDAGYSTDLRGEDIFCLARKPK